MMKAQKLMRLLLLVLVLSLCFGLLATSGLKLTAKAAGTTETYSYTFNEQMFTKTPESVALGSVTWTLTTDGSYWGYDGTKGQQIGSGKKPATTMSLSTEEIKGTITSITVNTSGASSTNATFSVKVGGVPFTVSGSESVALNASATNYKFIGSSTGEIVLSWSQTAKKAIYIKEIVVEYTTDGGGTIDPTTPSCDHVWDDGVVTKEATCTEDGVMTYTCTKCGETKTETIPAGGHAWDEGVVTKEATCGEDGVKTYTCTKCGETKIETIPATGEHTDANNDKLCDVCGANLPTFKKVTEAPADWSGTYLIVYETSETEGVIFDGSLEALDAEGNTQSVTISGNQITADLKYSFSIEQFNGNYAIKSASGLYIYRTADSNGLDSRKNEPYEVSIGFAQDGDLEIVSKSAHLRYNSSANQLRFRFYKSTSYKNQKAISLYKLVEAEPVTPIEPAVDGAVLNAVSATLEGDIGLNYYVTLPSSVRNAQGAEIQFTVNGVTTPVPVSSGTLVSDGAYKGMYKFTYRMNAKEMHDEVTFAVYDGTGLVDLYSVAGANKGTSFAYTLANYFQKLIDNNSGDADLVALAEATLAYGSYAQLAFDYNPDTVGTLADVTDVTAATLQDYAMTKTTELPAGLTLSEMTLVLKTETKICLYFEAADISSYSFKLDGKDVTPTETTDRGYCIEIANVSAKDLDKQHTLAIDGSCELTFSALSYAYTVVNNNTDANLCNAVKALYKYNQAANLYFGA